MGTSDMSEPLATKAREAVVAELERQSAESPQRLKVQRTGESISVKGEIDIDALVLVVVGAAAGGP